MDMIKPTIGIVSKAWRNTFGSVMNISDGPLSGCTPTENAAGNIINPARMAINESSSAICVADLSILLSFLKYEA